MQHVQTMPHVCDVSGTIAGFIAIPIAGFIAIPIAGFIAIARADVSNG